MSAFDVAVVGGGPAGSWAAAKLAAAGARVVLIDGSHPREKPCGGGITGRALALLGSSVERLVEGVPIESASFAHRERIVTVPLEHGGGLRLAVISRRLLDAQILDRAESAGAAIVRARVTGVVAGGTGWQIATRAGELEAKWVIGADGPGSLVRRRVSSPLAREDLSIAAGYYVHGVSSRQIAIRLEEDPPGYLWAFPRPDHLAVGVCAQADLSGPSQLLAASARWIDSQVTGGTRERYSWPIPSLGPVTLEQQQPSGKGWMLIGDAAGLVDPITREGIFFALTSAELAATSFLEGRDPARAYAERLRDTIYVELLFASRIKARFFQPRFMSLLISALQRSPRIRDIMSDLVAGEQPYHTLRARLLQTLEWRLMLELFGFVAPRRL